MIIFMYTFRSRQFPNHYSSNLSDLSYNSKLNIFHFKATASSILNTEIEQRKEPNLFPKKGPIIIINPIFREFEDDDQTDSIDTESTREKIIKVDSEIHDITSRSSSVYRHSGKKDNRELHEHLCIGRIIKNK